MSNRRLPFHSGDLRLRTVALYVVCFAVAWLVPEALYRWQSNDLAPYFAFSPWRAKPGVQAKIDHYWRHRDDYDVIFVGDSRTYCGISPTELDPLLGTRSFNVSTLAHWFPTQFASLQDLLPHVPRNTVVVWSIGHQNFRRVGAGEVNSTYPIGMRNVPRYLRWGYPWSSIRANVIDYFPGLRLYSRRAHLRALLEALWGRPLRSGGSATATELVAEKTSFDESEILPRSISSQEVERRMAEIRAKPSTMWVEPFYSGPAVTSLSVFQRGGNYVRVELDEPYFRAMQGELAAHLKPEPVDRFVADPEYWQAFLGIVGLFDRYGVRLVVNEFEEAPYHYQIPHNRDLYRNFMNDIRRFFESRGTPYVRVDFERLQDDDYFDYNHLNSKGIPVFSRMFADALRPHLLGK